MANKLLNIARGIAEKDNAKMKIELPEGDGPIQYKFEKTTKDSSVAWDNYYANAGLFINGYAEEIKINADDIRKGTLTLTEKARIEPVFKANIARQLWGFARKDDRQQQMNYLILGGLAIVIFMMVM